MFAGPAELSEQESRNIRWVPQTLPNIKFSMNIHSFGNYFMWSPGAYSLPDRTTLPRPSFGTFAWNFEVGDAGFQPMFEPEGHEQALEFSNGLTELFRVA